MNRDYTKKTVSLCMIVKNEETHLSRCLDSVCDIVDEIIIVDTGSSDGTLSIAEQYGAVVVPYVWNHHFAEARNVGLKLATSDFVLVLDADEELDRGSVAPLQEIIQSGNGSAYYVELKNFIGSYHPHQYYKDTSCRLFRNVKGYSFSGRIHEDIAPSILKSGDVIQTIPIVLNHYGYLNQTLQDKNKSERNLQLVELALKENPSDVRCLYAYGAEQLQQGRNVEALQTFISILETLPVSSDIFPDVLLKTISIYKLKNDIAMVLQLTEKGLNYFPHFTDLLDLKAEVLSAQKDYSSAIKSLQQSLQAGNEKGKLSVMGGSGSYRTAYALGGVYERLQDYETACYYYQIGLTMLPAFEAAWSRWCMLKLCMDQEEEVFQFVRQYHRFFVPSQWEILRKWVAFFNKENSLRDLEDCVQSHFIGQSESNITRLETDEAYHICFCLLGIHTLQSLHRTLVISSYLTNELPLRCVIRSQTFIQLAMHHIPEVDSSCLSLQQAVNGV
ncbi:tetratricopeptide repeat-containing glycosyltransferase family 2 protein [Fictibacillus phosphorivorans]|uniref:tetratricopeptide repeat-containing glycosyltransferase family 2 protein n=1 Tax=Fictibacillus phosphorivorans TaxID=1221500 RepID=UPI00119DE911|nr:glycosyltransferase family 2 protein [Fictibacillus phosphorivorans]